MTADRSAGLRSRASISRQALADAGGGGADAGAGAKAAARSRRRCCAPIWWTGSPGSMRRRSSAATAGRRRRRSVSPGSPPCRASCALRRAPVGDDMLTERYAARRACDMFTGIDHRGRHGARDRSRSAPARTCASSSPRRPTAAWADTAATVLGASIACSGCCLTVVDVGAGLVRRRLPRPKRSRRPRSAPGGRARGSIWSGRCGVGDELGGHIVSGHVDGVGEVLSATPENGSTRWLFRCAARRWRASSRRRAASPSTACRSP